MSRSYSHLNTAKAILENYHGKTPFAQELKHFFSGQKKYGSNDRRQIRSLCYCYFRLACSLESNLNLEEKILQGYFLCTQLSNRFLEELKPDWVPLIGLSAKEKCAYLGLNIELIFPYLNHLDDSIDKIKFAASHLIQPDLFLRIRPNQEQAVKHKLDKNLVTYSLLNSHCLALNNTTKIESLLHINREVIIQDYASQQVGSMLDKVKAQFNQSKDTIKVWDCCAASGGKAILAVDKLGPIDLSVSDIRANILHNLKKRLKEAKIVGFQSKQIDLTNQESIKSLENFDLIIADVPCTGSGTWSRTPERLSYFNENEIEYYTKLQKNITENIQTKLKPGAFLLYITCSVYQQENSVAVTNLVTNFGLEHLASEIYSGYEHKADTMFAALLRKPVVSSL